MTSRAPLLSAASLMLLALLPTRAVAMTLPFGFVDEPVPFTFNEPTKIAFLPDGRLLVAEKGGTVWVCDDTAVHPMWSHEAEVLNKNDFGLVGIAVDPHFTTNRRLYFLYTCDPDSDGDDSNPSNAAFGRLTRYEVSATDSDAVDSTTRAVLVGTTWSDGWPSAWGAHHVDDLAWGADGTLLVSCGDGAHYETMDAGGLDPDLFLPGRLSPEQDIGAFRAQMLGSLSGKVLRIDPETGLGMPSNPFYLDGDPGSARSRLWTYGLRNPFRITIRPGTGSSNPADAQPGSLYIGDVGWVQFEEIDVARTGGMNFGWPCRDGLIGNTFYEEATPVHDGCWTIGTPDNPSLPTDPIVTIHHSDASQSDPPGITGLCMTGGVFYTGSRYPAEYRGAYIFGDYGEGWIRTLRTDSLDRRVAVRDFIPDSDSPVSFATDPITGDIWFVTIWEGTVHHLRFTSTLAVESAAAGSVALAEPVPNPATRAVQLALTLPAPADVRLEILDLSGRRLWRSDAAWLGPGTHELAWPVVGAAGERARPGLYFARVTAGPRVLTRRVAVVK